MNTLNCKVLLIKTGLLVFIGAVGIYLLLTMPVMIVQPFMYMMSAIYAVSFGWIAAFLFLLLFFVIQKLNIDLFVKTTLLYTSVVLSVLVAFQMMEVTGVEERIWYSGWFLLFPTVAIIAGWVSLAVSGKKIKRIFSFNTIIQNNFY